MSTGPIYDQVIAPSDAVPVVCVGALVPDVTVPDAANSCAEYYALPLYMQECWLSALNPAFAVHVWLLATALYCAF